MESVSEFQGVVLEEAQAPYIADDTAAGGVAGPEPEGPPPYAAWLVEHGSSPIWNPLYLTLTADAAVIWQDKPDHAMQFAREVDAKLFAKLTMPGIDVRAAEHGFAP